MSVADLAALQATKTDCVFAPEVSEMYPDGFTTAIMLNGPALGLEPIIVRISSAVWRLSSISY